MAQVIFSDSISFFAKKRERERQRERSLVPSLHKFTIRNLDLFFSFFGKTRCVLTDLSIFGEGGKKLSRQKVGLYFAGFS